MKNNSNPYTSRTAVLVNGWIYPPNPSFRASTSAIRYTFPRIFVWLPRYLTEVIKCPRCSSHSTKSDGWPTHPIARRVVDLHDCYYLATRRQKCNACNLSFMGNGLSILKSLPPHSLSLYPAFLTHRSGMDFQVINLLRHSVSESFGFESFKRLLKANHMRRHDERSYSTIRQLRMTRHLKAKKRSIFCLIRFLHSSNLILVGLYHLPITCPTYSCHFRQCMKHH